MVVVRWGPATSPYLGARPHGIAAGVADAALDSTETPRKPGRRWLGCGPRQPAECRCRSRRHQPSAVRSITKGTELLPVIVDRVPVRVQKKGKSKGSKIDAAHLNAMLQSEVFLGHFLPVDQITTVPMYLPGFVLTKPGHNDGGQDQRMGRAVMSYLSLKVMTSQRPVKTGPAAGSTA